MEERKTKNFDNKGYRAKWAPRVVSPLLARHFPKTAHVLFDCGLLGDLVHVNYAYFSLSVSVQYIFCRRSCPLVTGTTDYFNVCPVSCSGSSSLELPRTKRGTDEKRKWFGLK